MFLGRLIGPFGQIGKKPARLHINDRFAGSLLLALFTRAILFCIDYLGLKSQRGIE